MLQARGPKQLELLTAGGSLPNGFKAYPESDSPYSLDRIRPFDARQTLLVAAIEFNHERPVCRGSPLKAAVRLRKTLVAGIFAANKTPTFS